MKAACGLLALVSLACSDLGKEPVSVIIGQLTEGPGVVFIERGPVHEGVFEKAGRIDEDGRFEIEVPSPGTWGVHTYVEGFIYLPMQAEVLEGLGTDIGQPAIAWQVFRNNTSWSIDARQGANLAVVSSPVDEDHADNPVLSGPAIESVGADAVSVSVDVVDPDGDLSNQVLAFFTGTGDGMALNPPAAPVDNDYPDGRYTASYFLPPEADPDAPWVFVAADNACSISEILETRLGQQ